MAFQRAAKLEEIPEGRGLCVRLSGQEIGLYRNGDKVYALENACPHAGFPLHEGGFDGQRVTCEGHGWEYDVQTGLPEGLPGEAEALRWVAKVEGDEVFVDLDAPVP